MALKRDEWDQGETKSFIERRDGGVDSRTKYEEDGETQGGRGSIRRIFGGGYRLR